jgi:hypothetical protein
MRIFELHEDEHVYSGDSDFTHGFPQTVVDLDSIVMVQATTLKYQNNPTKFEWRVYLSSGNYISVTETAFDRVLLAWKSG